MRNTRLSNHTFKKGKFITPFHTIPMAQELEDEKSWTYGRMPEYLWIGMVLNYFGREDGLVKIYSIISKLHQLAPELYTARLSQILKLDDSIQKQLYEHITSIGAKEALAPLTVYLTASRAPVFAECFFCTEQSISDRCETLIQTMREIMDHQSNEATDIRFAALYFYLLSGKLHLQQEQIDLLHIYPRAKHADEIMRMVRPNVRSLEMMILTFENTDSKYLKEFWRCVSEMTECNIFSIAFPEEKRNVTAYMERIHDVFVYLTELFTMSDPLNEKMNVLLGIATYSFKRFKEVYDHNMFNSISGRSCVRVLIENYIMMKYLVKNEASHENIWRDYQLYGIGLYKLVLARHREHDALEESHFDEKYIEALPFILLGDRHILDDPLSKYAEIRSNMSESKDAGFLSEQIGITAEDNIKILENSQGEILILPVRLFNQANADSPVYHLGAQAFISLFNGIDSINDYFSKCTTIDDIMRFARKDIGSLIMFSEVDDMTLPFKKRFRDAIDNTTFMVDSNKHDSENFFMLVYGYIQQAVDVIVSCVEYGCIPYIRHPVALHYISLLSENMLDLEHINKLRYKMSVAFIVYMLMIS